MVYFLVVWRLTVLELDPVPTDNSQRENFFCIAPSKRRSWKE